MNPMAGLRNVAPPPFLTKTFDMVEDPKTNEVVSWSAAGNSFVVWDVDRFSTILLPANFNHTNFSSFVRQLYIYGFRKIDQDRLEFANPEFLSGKRHLLKSIKRRQRSKTGENGEVEKLRQERNRLVMEILKAWQKAQSDQAQVLAMRNRLEMLERQQKVLIFFVAALEVSSLVHQAVTGGSKKWRLSETSSTEINSDASKSGLGAAADGEWGADNVDDLFEELLGDGEEIEVPVVHFES